jgi:hypothetical protein
MAELERTLDQAGTRAGGVKAYGSHEHAGQVQALYDQQLEVHLGETGGTLVPGLGTCGRGEGAEELHNTGTESPQGFTGDPAVRVSQTVLVCKVRTLCPVLETSGLARGACGRRILQMFFCHGCDHFQHQQSG